ncbi:ABC transporter G family member 10-like, partial [Hevea brasiliensis]|uniref:ABC transporter G family member 10-like n=1 Tax=Hevea brasiliensis TaxID=3981 RepID=UPI0025DBEE84
FCKHIRHCVHARLRLRGKAIFKLLHLGLRLLKELGLEHDANVRIGSETSWGISGVEKRRVSIGVDQAHDPPILLIDEPTSGLYSASALHVVMLLKSMATKQSKTILLTTINLVSQIRILELFDQILLSNGTVVHQGSLHLL